MLASEVKAQLEAPPAAATGAAKDDDDAASSKKSPVAEHHHALLLRLLAEELQVAPEQIADFELQLVDTQPSTVGGALREFVFSGRLDNLCSSYQALTALVDSCHGGAAALATELNVRLVALFDHEEIGSVSAQGAASSLMPEILQRVSQTLGYGAPDVHARVLRRSYIVSADMAHALHPNYADKHDPGLQPKMHGGLVIKVRWGVWRVWLMKGFGMDGHLLSQSHIPPSNQPKPPTQTRPPPQTSTTSTSATRPTR